MANFYLLHNLVNEAFPAMASTESHTNSYMATPIMSSATMTGLQTVLIYPSMSASAAQTSAEVGELTRTPSRSCLQAWQLVNMQQRRGLGNGGRIPV